MRLSFPETYFEPYSGFQLRVQVPCGARWYLAPSDRAGASRARYHLAPHSKSSEHAKRNRYKLQQTNEKGMRNKHPLFVSYTRRDSNAGPSAPEADALSS